MATLTVSLPETMKEWIEAQVEHGTFASASDYPSDLVRRDQEEQSRDHDERLEEIRRIVDEADAVGSVRGRWKSGLRRATGSQNGTAS